MDDDDAARGRPGQGLRVDDAEEGAAAGGRGEEPVEPLPDEAKLIAPGLDLASAISSVTDFAGRDGLTARSEPTPFRLGGGDLFERGQL